VARRWPEEFASLLRAAFGERHGQELAILAERGNLPAMAPLAPAARRALLLSALRRQPLGTLRNMAGHVAAEARIRMRPPGLRVALLGPDGAGKSTLSRAIAAGARSDLPFRSVKVPREFAVALPPLSSLRHRGAAPHGAAADDVDPYRSRRSSPVASVLEYGYYGLDPWVAAGASFRRRRGYNQLLLHDRHMLELGLFPRRYGFGGPAWLARAMAKVIPRPDLVILLDAPLEVFRSRKQDVAAETSAHEQAALRAFVAAAPRGATVNADQPVEDVAADVRTAIVDTLAARTRHRMLGRGDAEAGGRGRR
jgi:hypothetical protein